MRRALREPAGRLCGQTTCEEAKLRGTRACAGSRCGCALLQQHLGAAQQQPLQVPAGQARSHQAGHDGARPRRSIHQQHRARALQALRGDRALGTCQAFRLPAGCLQNPRRAASMGLEASADCSGARQRMLAHAAGSRRRCTSNTSAHATDTARDFVSRLSLAKQDSCDT
jgi:hypothetical protein